MPGKPSSVEADPRMLPTNTGELKKKKRGQREEKAGKKKKKFAESRVSR